MASYVAGDQAAFKMLFRRYASVLHGMARRQLRSDELARDVVQQTFLQMHRARFDFRQDARLKPWIFTITTNLVREHYRRTGRKPETSYEDVLENSPDIEPTEDPVDLGEIQYLNLRKSRLKEALKSIPENQRIVIELHWFQELSFPEVAQVVGATVSAVKVRAHRGYKRLRTILEEMERNDEMAPRA